MCSHFNIPVHDQRGRYNSAAHESLRAVVRSLYLHLGRAEVSRRTRELSEFMGVKYGSDLSPEGAYYIRKILEKQLPIRGDYAS